MAKIGECREELKQTMVNSLICLDFYKDLENYLSENKYEDQPQEVTQHFDVIEELIQHHGLYSLDFDTERTSRLIDSITSYLRVPPTANTVISIKMPSDDYNKSDDENEEEEGLKVRVKRLEQQ